MGDVVSLKLHRKRKARAGKEAEAEQNRIEHGRSRADPETHRVHLEGGDWPRSRCQRSQKAPKHDGGESDERGGGGRHGGLFPRPRRSVKSTRLAPARLTC